MTTLTCDRCPWERPLTGSETPEFIAALRQVHDLRPGHCRDASCRHEDPVCLTWHPSMEPSGKVERKAKANKPTAASVKGWRGQGFQIKERRR